LALSFSQDVKKDISAMKLKTIFNILFILLIFNKRYINFSN